MRSASSTSASNANAASKIGTAPLAFQDRAGPSAYLAVAEDREHHGRVGRGERGAEDARARPAEVEQIVGSDRDQSSGREGPEDAERGDRCRRGPEAAPADVHASVEEDHDERDDPDPLHVADRQDITEGLEVSGSNRGREQEERGRGERKALGHLAREDREEKAHADHEHDAAEVGQLLHGMDSTDLTFSLHITQRGHTARGDTREQMRLILVPLSVLALLVPVASAGDLQRGDGTLSIRDGRGTVVVHARGAVIGQLTRFDRNGKLVIEDVDDDDGSEPRVVGADWVRARPDGTPVYGGKAIRFRLIGGPLVPSVAKTGRLPLR